MNKSFFVCKGYRACTTHVVLIMIMPVPYKYMSLFRNKADTSKIQTSKK